MTTAWSDGRKTRPDGEVREPADGGDELLDREALEPIGDSIADAWFRHDRRPRAPWAAMKRKRKQ